MKYNNKIVISSVLLTLLSTGCVKPTEEVNTAKNNNAVVAYEEQPGTVTYEEATPIIYGDPTTTTSNNVIYGTPTNNNTYETTATNVYSNTTGTGDGTIVATDHYQQTAGSTSTANGAYGVPSGGEIYNSVDDPYINNTPPNSYSSNNNYSNNNYSTNYTNNVGSGIQLQVAALKDYYAAEEFKRGLSLDPKYSAYVKKGPMNKVIITGLSSRAEAKALAARQFPGAFIVSGSSYSSGGSSSSYSKNNSYTTNTSYSYSSSSANSHSSGIGVQVGAFSSKIKARSVAKAKAGGRYTSIVKTAKVRGRTVYKAIIVGFASRREAKNAINSGQFGSAFIVSVH